jgi:periplasmic protein TonB
MTALALHHHPDGWEFRRYGAAAIAIVLLHVVLIAAAFFSYQRSEPAGISLPAIHVDLAPPPAAQQIQTEDSGVGPTTQEAEAPPPEPPKTEMLEQLPPTPIQEKPVVAAPPKVEPKPEPAPAKPQPVKDVKKPIKKRLVEASKASKADRIAPETPSVSSGATAAASAASYRALLVAHLQRFKRWPAGAEARGENGKAFVAFTVTRSGGVSGARLTKSTGYASLDQEALAWIQRAQPMPSFPAEMREASMSFTAPLNWERR